MPNLLPHQQTGAEWLAGKRHALLADEMRVGKAVQTVVACDILDAQRILVICPAVARINWLREFGKFSTRSLPMRALLSSRDSPLSQGVNVVSYDFVGAFELQTLLGGAGWPEQFDVLVRLGTSLVNPSENFKEVVAITSLRIARNNIKKSFMVCPLTGLYLIPDSTTFSLFPDCYNPPPSSC